MENISIHKVSLIPNETSTTPKVNYFHIHVIYLDGLRYIQIDLDISKKIDLDICP
jgi:hypothetical protein